MKILAILLGKLAIKLGKLLHRGSSMPGSIALKIDKHLLSKFKLPKTIIAVTGSSGKGSTSSIIAAVYRKMGYSVVHNFSGSNLTPGITTTLIENCSITGKVDADIFVFEMDERFAKFVFPVVKPTHIVITNITRDQPPRQGHFDLVYEEIKKALPIRSHLILNGDDPYSLKFNLQNEYETTYYTLDKTDFSYTKSLFRNLNICYCPKCNHKLDYEYYHFETLGRYSCPNCDFKCPTSDFHITGIDYPNFEMTINNNIKIKLQYDLLFSVYNTMAAFTLLSILGLDQNEIANCISSLNQDKKIYNHYLYNGHEVYILNNKNENSTTFNQSLLFTKRFKGSKTIVIGWKEISRRYNFDDLSWLYDIDFELLKDCNVENIVCAGPQAYDIATRIELAGFDKSIIHVFSNLQLSKPTVDKFNSKYIFGILNFDYVEPFKTLFYKEDEQ